MHRGLWAIPCAALIIWWLGQYKDVWQAVASKRNLAILTLTGAIIVFNWGFYVWSIEVGRTLEASLGYYINPLLNVVMGYLFLGERFNRLQMVALVLALVAVLIQTFAAGVFPWLGLMLAATFCLYGFLRKTIAVGPTQGFFIEVCIIAIPLLLTQVWLVNNGEAHFGGTLPDTLLLMGLRPDDDVGAGVLRAVDKTAALFNRRAAAIYLANPGVPHRRLHLRRTHGQVEAAVLRRLVDRPCDLFLLGAPR